ncbi:YybH family protein [Sulfitobacter aestuariivivens]|uniref:SgcJ/EcaC family oxidoreductase n=1 Tax=Sulfitobacter aestuariivivens TaxID=2766981 RepID=A0A927D1L2_9RHOB|nr:SgcJ/EcaC family oxidoreductase [Sulfitobacter aestuariivivens]MBD3662721.1 SgcJ/EcaC family oxidoreductase [Sulfitobacter aestuariivivens]
MMTAKHVSKPLFRPIGKLVRLLALLCFLQLPISAMAEDNPIIARMAELVAAYNAQDAQAVASFYAKDGILLPPGQKAILGSEAIAAHYAAAFKAGARELQFKTFDIRPHSDTAATEIGETVVMVGRDRIVGRYMHLWQVIDGSLLLTRDMYHILKVN